MRIYSHCTSASQTEAQFAFGVIFENYKPLNKRNTQREESVYIPLLAIIQRADNQNQNLHQGQLL